MESLGGYAELLRIPRGSVNSNYCCVHIGDLCPTALSIIKQCNKSPLMPLIIGTYFYNRNKSDRFTEREVDTLRGIALAMKLGCKFVEASATRCTNVEEAFYDVVRLMRRKRKQIKMQAMSGQVEKFAQRTVVKQS
jgi:hypothetical protein